MTICITLCSRKINDFCCYFVTISKQHIASTVMLIVFIPSSGSFVDFVSILNQYCQKNRLNVPKYGEAPGVQGGFGAQVLVKGEIFTTMKYCLTKKEARHDAAKCALLGLNIPVGRFL